MHSPSRFAELRTPCYWLAGLLAGLLLTGMLPAPDATHGLAGYAPLHTGMEMLAMAIAAMVFGISWTTQKYRPNGRTLILGLGLLGVALLDLGHSLSYAGMPDFITPNGAEKAINFWLAARTLAAVTLLWAALWPAHQPGPARQADRWLWLLVVLLSVAAAYFVLLARPGWIPQTFSADTGLTPFKVHFEYGLIAAYLLAGVLFGLQLPRGRGPGLWQLMLAAWTMAMSEYFLTLYANVGDAYNITGHVYKILAFGFLYRGLFVATVHRPYQDLLAAQASQRATLDMLPDMLFEVSRQGVYLSVHANEAAKLTNPADQLLGKRIDEIMPPEVAALVFMALADAERNGVTRGQRFSLAVPAGLLHFELAIARKPGATPEEDSYLALARDITATVREEERMAHQSRLHAALLDLQQGDGDEPEADFLRRAVWHAQQLTASALAAIHFVRDGPDGCELVASTAAPASQPGLSSQCLQALREHRPVVLNLGPAATYANAHAAEQPAPAGVQRLVSLPLLERDQVRMLLCVANKALDYDEQDVQTLQIVADTIWRCIHRRRQDALIHRLSEALEQSPHQVVICDTRGQVLYVNRAFTEVSGYGAEEILGRNPRVLQSGRTPRATYEDMWRRLPQGLPWRGELINRRKNGQIYTENASLYPIRGAGGQITHYVAHKEDITQLREAKERIRALSNIDTLTGLPNKKAFDEQLAQAIEAAGAGRQQLSVVWLNLDNFKLINESLGHAAGDELLAQMAQRLHASLGQQATLARYSGDAFAAIVPRADQASVALMVQQALRQLQTATSVQGRPVSISASAGIAVYPGDARTASTLASAAEVAMYRVKQDGRNGLRFFAPEMQAHTQRSLELATGLKDAAHRGELFLVYQPQRALDSGALVGAEALLRWRHPQWGLVSPAEFIPIAEQSGAITAIDFWVVEQAARQIRAWDAAGLPPLVLAVNLSAAQFGRPQLVEELLHIMRRVDVPPRRIEVELTEAVALKYPELAETTMRRLHEEGFKVALDDFGTGYSSMSYLKRYAIDKLKIDQSFIKDLTAQHSDLAIVTAIVKMAHTLGMGTIAEGVETAEQAQLLQACGCDEIQGYWYSRPLEPAAFEAFAKQPAQA